MNQSHEYQYGIKVFENEVIPVITENNSSRYVLYFNAESIKFFDEANDLDQRKFASLCERGISIVGKQNQAGIKALGHSGVDVLLTQNGKNILLPITHELKINNSAARVGLVCIQPKQANHPQLLVATLFLENGLHAGKAKKYRKNAYSLSQHGLFKNRNTDNNNRKENKLSSLAL